MRSAACSGPPSPCTSSQLAALYPTHGQFVLKWDLATLRDMFHGYLLWPDALELARAAASSNVGT